MSTVFSQLHTQIIAEIAAVETCTADTTAKFNAQQVADETTFTVTTAATEAGVEPVVTQEAEQLAQQLITTLLGKNLCTAENVVATLGTIASLRQSWEATELAASHRRLYAILSSCYAFYLRMKNTSIEKAVRDNMSKGLNMFITQRGFRTLAKTHDMNRVVKAVFGEDRRRVSAYAAALKVALTAGSNSLTGDSVPIDPSELSAWITLQGGIEEIRKVKNNTTIPVLHQAEKARVAMQSVPLTSFKPDPRELSFDADEINKPQVLVATFRANGELEINCVIKSQSVIQAALAAYYEKNNAVMQKPATTEAPLTATGAALEQTI